MAILDVVNYAVNAAVSVVALLRSFGTLAFNLSTMSMLLSLRCPV